MDAENLKKLISKIETEIPVQDWKVNGIDVWPYFKIKLGLSMYFAELKSETKESKNTFFEKVILANIIFFKSLFQYFFRRSSPRKIMTLSFSSCRANTPIGTFNRFMDSLRYYDKKSKKIDVVSLELPNPVYNFQSSAYPFFPIQFFISLFNKFPFKTEISFFLPGFEKYQEILKQENIPVENMAVINSKFKSIFRTKKFTDLILKIFNPDCVLLTCFFSKISVAMILSCKDRGIPVYDVQHGVITSTDHIYGYWNNVESYDLKLFPTGFIVWSEREKDVLKKWTNNNLKIIISGNLFFEVWGKEFSSNIERKIINETDKPIVLLCLQHSTLSDFILEIMDNSKKDFFWAIRVHPQYLSMISEFESELCKRVGKGGFEIQISSTTPLPALLKISDLHVTYSSTTAIEAYMMGIKTIFLDKLGIQYFEDLLPKEYVNYLESADRFTGLATSLISTDERNTNLKMADAFNLDSVFN